MEGSQEGDSNKPSSPNGEQAKYNKEDSGGNKDRRSSEQVQNLLNLYPTCRMIIKQYLDLRQPRRHKTHCLYIHGPTGIGKTRMTHAYLRLE